MPVDYWDTWFIHILSARLDPESRKLWETELSNKDSNGDNSWQSAESDMLNSFPKFAEFAEFLEKRAQTLNIIGADKFRNDERRIQLSGKSIPGSRKILHARSVRLSGPQIMCGVCTNGHFTSKCPKLASKSIPERRAEIRKSKLCFNCLGNHVVRTCNSSGRCGTCGGKHHTMLHQSESEEFSRPQNEPKRTPETPSGDQNSEPTPVKALTASIRDRPVRILLATARVDVYGPHGTHTRVRALLDQGSEVTFISESVVQLLALREKRTLISLSGLGGNASEVARSSARVTLKSKFPADCDIEVDALVLRRLTLCLPSGGSVEFDMMKLEGIELADSRFFQHERVDMILGADIFGQVIRSGLRRFPGSNVVVQKTVFGWVLSGPIKSVRSRRASDTDSSNTLHCASDNDLNSALARFWLLEEPNPCPVKLKPEDERCEEQFSATHRRDQDGRFTVRLPLRADPPSSLRETCLMAVASVSHLHRRFSRDERLNLSYREFMGTYERLGHMERVPDTDIENRKAWYLPHHAVVQASSNSWKLRVVFDASRKTRDLHSLNEYLLQGPALQSDLSLILLNWRRYRYVFTADIIEMFRQIYVAPCDRVYQRIVWVPSAKDAPVDYQLTTVTYGTSCAPYLAITTLKQLIADEELRFPLGAQCLRDETYVDDVFVGADNVSFAVDKRDQLIGMLRTAGIELRKWAANHSDLYPDESGNDGRTVTKTIDCDEAIKALGVQWHPAADEFRFQALDTDISEHTPTKRYVLLEIARLFDPLGWLAPVSVVAKILMQDLWISNCNWDHPLPEHLEKRWREYRESLRTLSSLSINRWLGVRTCNSYQVHGFSDASQRAYAAAVYLRIDEGNGRFRSSLLAAKSKVAPVKTVSVPNLESCGAVLLTKLIVHLSNKEPSEVSPSDLAEF